MRNLFESYAELPLFLRRPLWRIWHNFLVKQDKSLVIKFMNYGYAPLTDSDLALDLTPEDEPERYCINLYHHDVEGVDLEGKEILEVGCGRGGGASYISRYFKPKTYIGLDLSKKAIRFCNRKLQSSNLSFVQGNAEDLPFEDNSFDAIVNVESSRCYPHVDKFLSEVQRVLRPGGHLLFSDMRFTDDLDVLREQFKNSGLKILEEEDVLPNIVKALELDSVRRETLIDEKCPKFLRKSAREFSGTLGSERYRLFKDGEMQYHRFRVQKAV